ncbi:MAG: cysteine hydrolase [Candidatus Diapherotrites archaeon]|nr:cysteine hydrolase [Candidatus Diapherotrites archaeon]
MLHWQNGVAHPKGVWGKMLYPQIKKNKSIPKAKKALSAARRKKMLTVFVNIAWRPGYPEMPKNQYYPLMQGAKDANKALVGSWDAKVIKELEPKKDDVIVINYGSDGFEGTDLDLVLRSAGVDHVYISGQCTEHVIATTVKRAANKGYNVTLLKDATSGFTDSNYDAMMDILPLYAKMTTSDKFAKSL